MTSGRLLRVCLIFLVVDHGCLTVGERQSWVYSLGMRGLMTDFLLLLVVSVYTFFEGVKNHEDTLPAVDCFALC